MNSLDTRHFRCATIGCKVVAEVTLVKVPYGDDLTTTIFS